jgi:hypothetical protein
MSSPIFDPNADDDVALGLDVAPCWDVTRLGAQTGLLPPGCYATDNAKGSLEWELVVANDGSTTRLGEVSGAWFLD